MATQRAATYREVFAVAEFRALFAAHLLSVVGDQFARVALAILVYERTKSTAWTALTYALTFLPSLVAGPLLSGLADRFPRRRLMVTTDLARAALVALMAVPGMPLLAVGALLVAVQMLAAPFNAARTATLPVILEGDRFVVASGIMNITYQFALLAGFASGGVLVAGVDITGALLIDSATFVASALLVRFGVAARPTTAAGSSGSGPWLDQITGGARLVWNDHQLRLLVAMACLAGFYVTVEGLAVPYADSLGAGAAGVGLLLAASPLGAVIGILLISRLAPSRRLRLMGPLAVCASLPLVLCALRPGLLVTVLLWTASGAAASYQIVANAEFVRKVPDTRRGQAYGLAVTALLLSQGIGVLATGAIAEVVAPTMVVAFTGAVGTVAAVGLAAAWRRAVGSSAGHPAPADDASSS